VGAFRIAFGLGLLTIVLRHPISEDWNWTQLALVAVLAAFTAGLWVQPTYALACAGLLAWAVEQSRGNNGHPYGALMIALLALLAAPWGDAWSVDGWLRARAGRPPRARSSVAYGYAIWIPGVALSIGFLAAAAAKLRESGVDWIANGTVKYHFLTDSPSAVVDWGTRLGFYPLLAVVVSAAAIALEAVVIAGALSRVYWRRALAGILAASALLGFWLFQGLFWPGWWVLLLSFLPWHRLAAVPAPTPALSPGWRRAQAMALIAVVVQQIVVSATRLEMSPFLSAYDMYSSTYASAAEYEADAGLSYWLVARDTAASLEPCGVSREVAEAWLDESRRDRDPEAARAAAACFVKERGRQLIVEGHRTRVDWTRWRLGDDERQVLGGPFPWE
jgi:hypothetical protein